MSNKTTVIVTLLFSSIINSAEYPNNNTANSLDFLVGYPSLSDFLEPEPAPEPAGPSSHLPQPTGQEAINQLIETGSGANCDFSGVDLRDIIRIAYERHQARLTHRMSTIDRNPLNLFRANLSNTDLRGTFLYGADMRYANLTGADARNAKLSHANLTGANVTNARFTRPGNNFDYNFIIFPDGSNYGFSDGPSDASLIDPWMMEAPIEHRLPGAILINLETEGDTDMDIS